MNWIKVNPNPADNDAHPERLPPLDKVVHIIFLSDFDEGEIITLGGRVEGEEGWVWAVNDNQYFYRRDAGKINDLVADDDYRVTHWAEIEWPK